MNKKKVEGVQYSQESFIASFQFCKPGGSSLGKICSPFKEDILNSFVTASSKQVRRPHLWLLHPS
jgi:hypothetical protein